MNVITITREYGAGGGEVARKLATTLGWELLDRELLHQAAEVEHLPDAELERLDEKVITMADRFRLHPPHQKYLHGLKRAAESAATRGNVVLVGRGARHLLGERPDVLHLRLVAPKPWRARRMSELEGWPLDESLARLTEMDRIRGRFARYFFGDKATQPAEYDLVFNTERVPLDDVAAVAAAIVRGASEARSGGPAAQPGSRLRVLTLSRELGAGEQGFAPTLGERLGMPVYDRELLEQEAVRLGVPEAELEKIDERGAGIFQRFRPGSIYQRYFEALGQLMHELAGPASGRPGGAIVVGRGGSRILRDDPRAFHVRLVAPLPVRVRRVMEYRWVREGISKKLIAESDARRSNFYESYFGADWSSPLEYDVTVNSGRLGLAAIEAVATAAEKHWSHTGL
jgi:cytidylate kinase